MHPKKKANCLLIFLSISALFLYCEYGIYYIILFNCNWPILDAKNADSTITPTKQAPVKAMILADTHLLGSRHGHWFDKLRREWQMHRAFQTALTLHNPDLVFVLGDLTDEGDICSHAEFNYHAQRFFRLFKVPDRTKMYLAVGNHDIGFHYRVSPYSNQRFVDAFNSSAVQLITLRGNHFVLVNSIALEGDGCFLCKAAELQLNKIGRQLQCAKGTYTEQCSSKLEYSRPILMQHYPLYRESDVECNDFDAAPVEIRRDRFRERWECLSQEATLQLLNQIKPRLALSGHTHHGCTRKLAVGDGVEISVPSFSWRYRDEPNFVLAIFTRNNYAFAKCTMPMESMVITLYTVGFSAIFIWICCITFFRKHTKYQWRYITLF